VSAAICLYEVTKRLHESTIDWQLTEEEKITQLIQWTKKVIKRGEAIERAFLKTL